jgi:hypothetical protein
VGLCVLSVNSTQNGSTESWSIALSKHLDIHAPDGGGSTALKDSRVAGGDRRG